MMMPDYATCVYIYIYMYMYIYISMYVYISIWVCVIMVGVGDRCWDQGMFRGMCFGYVSRHHELLYLQFRGYVTGYVSRVCNPCALLKLGPPKKAQTHMCVYIYIYT